MVREWVRSGGHEVAFYQAIPKHAAFALEIREVK